MPKIIVGTDVVNFPDNGSDALWSPAIIQFAELVADQLNVSSNPNDIPPSVIGISGVNAENINVGSNINTSQVRKFSMDYAIYREYINGLSIQLSITESGTFSGTYNIHSGIWTIQDEYFGDKKNDGTSYHLFSMSGNQIQLDTEAISGSAITPSDPSALSFSLKTELVET